MLALGYAAYEAQETEATVHLALSVIFELSAAESIDKLKAVYARKTLGQFQVLLREKLGLKPEFDRYMKEYIDMRNFITHNLSRTSIFSIDTDDGRKKFFTLVTEFRHRNRRVHMSFAALTEMWMRLIDPRHGDERLKDLRETELIQEIERDFIPRLRTMFGRDA